MGIKPARGAIAALLRTLALVPIGAGVGALGGGLYGTVCGALYDLVSWELAKVFSWGWWLAVAGAGAGALVGIGAAIDRARNQGATPARLDKGARHSRAVPQPRDAIVSRTPRERDRAPRFYG